MEIGKRKKGDWAIIDLAGDVGRIGEAIAFKKLLDAVLAEGARLMAVNFEKAASLSSDYINSILSAHHGLKRSGGEMVLIGNDVKICETLEIIGIPMVMTIFENEQSFEEARLSQRSV